MDSRLDLEQRRRVREFVRTHHPDLGGDHETFVRGLAELRSGRPVATTVDVVFYRRRRGITAMVVGVGTMVTRRRRLRRLH